MNRATQDSAIQPAWTDKRFWIWFLAISGLFIFCYLSVFTILIGMWWNNTSYSHGFLVPIISLYLIWVNRSKLEHLLPSPSYMLGLPVLGTGLLMHLTGHVGGVLLLQELSIIVTIAGIVLLVLGIKYLKSLWFPITYLLFMLTVWGTVITGLHLPFQHFSATIGTEMLQFIGIPAYRESIYIELPNITLEVARVCSGVNYLIAVVAIGIPLAYVTLNSWWRGVVLVVGGLIIAILGNGLRIALIGTLSYYNMAGDLHGPYHILQGMFVSVIGFVALFIGAWLLSRGTSAAPADATIPAAPQLESKERTKYPLFITVGVLLLLGSYISLYTPDSAPLKRSINYFPYEIGQWKGTDAGPDLELFRASGVDHELLRVYRTTGGKEIQLYIGYYGLQTQGKELINDQTSRLHQGSNPIGIGLNAGESIEINRLVQQYGRSNRLTLFWYDLNGRVVTDRYRAKLLTIWDALVRARTNGAIVVVSIDLEGAETAQDLEDAEGFVRDITPLLRDYLP